MVSRSPGSRSRGDSNGQVSVGSPDEVTGRNCRQNLGELLRPNGHDNLPSGKLTKLLEITIFNGKTDYK